MEKYNRISSIVLIIVATCVCVGSVKVGLGTFHAPGSGFFPFSAALFLGLFSSVTLIKAGSGPRSELAAPPGPTQLYRVIKAIIGLLSYISLLPLVGYVTGTFLIMLFFFKGVESVKWLWAVLAAIVTVFATYLIFDVWLQCMLPVGSFDLWKVIHGIF